VFTQYKQRTEVGLSNGHDTVAGWRHLLLISAPGAFHDFQSAIISETGRAGLDVSKEHEYETKVDLSIGQVVSLDGDNYRQFPLTICLHDLQKR
jgi:hypothetical protein